MAQSPYEMTDGELVDALRKASFRANSGGSFDYMASSYASDVWYIQGALLARLKGFTPPFRQGDWVKNTSDNEVRPANYVGKSIAPDERLEIKKIHFDCMHNKWLLQFRGIPDENNGFLLYETDEFKLETSAVVVAKA